MFGRDAWYQMNGLFGPQRMVRDYENSVAIEEPYRRPVSTAGVTPWDTHRP
jgi:hypothetical protein